ncbi:hypothetical protein ACBQ04_06930 [Psychrobacter faecalis]
MPYQNSSKKNEPGGKTTHMIFNNNPDIQGFLQSSSCLTAPTFEEAKKITEDYLKIVGSDVVLPKYIVASDSSPYTEPLKGLYPSTQIGYIKNSMVLIELDEFNKLTPSNSNYVCPFKAAELHRNGSDAIAFILPGCNVRYKNATTVKDGFRLAVYEQLTNEKTRFIDDVNANDSFSVVDTLIAIEEGEGLPKGTIKIDKCPSCGAQETFLFTKTQHLHECIECQEIVYITDSLRIHEQISDFGDNRSAITRFMNVVEHLIIASFIRFYSIKDPEALSKMAFILDGPLAIFGQPAKVHARLMKLYYKIFKDLQEAGFTMPLIIGIQKSGAVVDHAVSLAKYINNGSYRLIDDEYRHKYIAARSESSENFGHETYYGQDFIYKTENGKIFVFALTYPFKDKNIVGFDNDDFTIEIKNQELSIVCKKEALKTNLSNILNNPKNLIKVLSIKDGSAKLVNDKIIIDSRKGDISNVKVSLSSKKIFTFQKTELEYYYPLVEKAMKVISHFELELYENAIIPIALAHRHASISLVPGGKVLDNLSKNGLKL